MKKFIVAIAVLLCATLAVSGCSSNVQVTESPGFTDMFATPIPSFNATTSVPQSVSPTEPNVVPSVEPSMTPSIKPSLEPSVAPSVAPSVMPSTPSTQVSGWDVSALSALDNTAEGWGIPMKTGGAIPEVPYKTAKLFAKYSGFCMGDTTQKNIYLTFDCGYENGETPKILDALKAKNAKGVFFVTMDYVKSSPELVQRMIDEGHELGNHTVTHPNLTKISLDKFKSEILDLNEYVKEHFGVQMRYMRPPEGVFSERTLAATQALGMSTILWDFAYQDWNTSNQPGADYAYDKVMKHIHNGSILLLHAVSSSNADAMERIIDGIRNAGYIVSPLNV